MNREYDMLWKSSNQTIKLTVSGFDEFNLRNENYLFGLSVSYIE